MADRSDLASAQNEARRRVAAIAENQWDLATPCPDWTVRDLVVHLIEASRMASLLLDGVSADAARAVFGASHDPDLPAELDRALTDELAAFERPGVFDMVVHHPGAGDLPGARLLQLRTADYLIHSWDMARATTGDEHLPENLVAVVWEAMKPMAPVIGKIGVFGRGPSGTITEDAALQRRLLDLSGRRP
jgi:uncharacterized protein (TIGR03086 family)